MDMRRLVPLAVAFVVGYLYGAGELMPFIHTAFGGLS